MKSDASPSRVNWRKFAWLAIILLIAAYIYGQPTLEKWLGIDLPDLADNQPAHVESGEPATDGREPGRSGERPQLTNADNASNADNGPRSFSLKTIGRDRLESPAGLVYEMGPGGEHRIDHILRHAQDDPSRPVHSVFEAERDGILALLDEAYELVLAESKRVRKESDPERDWRTEYTVDMQREIGYEGGRSGRRKDFPRLRRLKLILDNGNEVVTAYPCR